MSRLSQYMRSDTNGYDGKYTVTSLYFEIADRTIYYETKNKLKYRQKLRLRVYDEVDEFDTAFFEVKQKHKKVVNKRRLRMTVQEANRYLAADLHRSEERRVGKECRDRQALKHEKRKQKQGERGANE